MKIIQNTSRVGRVSGNVTFFLALVQGLFLKAGTPYIS